MNNRRKIGVYAGSFDPWSVGHEFVLNSALTLFDEVHVLCAVNPLKVMSSFSLLPMQRSQIIAQALNPLGTFDEKQNSEQKHFLVEKNITIAVTDGLVAEYAKKVGAKHLIRGLRSTSDFESEFNLYFSNRALSPHLQTWTVMCPPELLHCSSTFVRAAVGKEQVLQVGTSFYAQCRLVLGYEISALLGEVFDIVCFFLQKKLEGKEFIAIKEEMQKIFAGLMLLIKNRKEIVTNLQTQIKIETFKVKVKNNQIKKVEEFFEPIYEFFPEISNVISEKLVPIFDLKKNLWL
jgi:pantetheine-phosphate adenylyltransferase